MNTSNNTIRNLPPNIVAAVQSTDPYHNQPIPIGGHLRNPPGVPLSQDYRSFDRSPIPQQFNANNNACNYSTIGDHNIVQAKTYASGFGLG